MSQAPQIPLNLPAVLIFLWSVNEEEVPLKAQSLSVEIFPGVHRLGPRLIALLPIGGDAAEVDLGIHLAIKIQQELSVGTLVLPGEVQHSLEGVSSIADPLLQDLERQPPSVDPESVYLTGYAAGRLGTGWTLESAGEYGGKLVSKVTLLRVAGQVASREPWHNLQLLGKVTDYVSRSELEQALLSQGSSPVLRVQGPIGCGKSRLVWNTLGPGARPLHGLPSPPPTSVWLNLQPPRYESRPLSWELLRALCQLFVDESKADSLDDAAQRLGLEDAAGWVLGDSPPPTSKELGEIVLSAFAACAGAISRGLRIVFDNLHCAPAESLEFLDFILRHRGPVRELRLVLINRLGNPWPEAASSAPMVPVSSMTAEHFLSLAKSLFEGLSLPKGVEDRLLEATGGLPLALEEGLVNLIHRRLLRRIYGSFFFNGGKDTDYAPSARWTQLVEAEARRLGGSDAMRLLALSGFALPPGELESAASLLAVKVSPKWENPYLEAGWVHRASSPWGMGLYPVSAAIRMPLAVSVEPNAAKIARRTIGEILAHSSDSPQARWQAYNLLSGTEAAVPPILELARSHGVGPGSEELLGGIAKELEAHRSRGGDAGVELQLLWVLLPMARRLNRLEDFEQDLERALEISAESPKKHLAFASLKTEVDLQKGRLAQGERTLRSALELVVEEDSGRQALLLLQLGRLQIRQGRYGEARALMEQLLPVLEKRKAVAQIASCRFHLGNIALHEDRLEEAFQLHREALEDRRREDNFKALGSSLSALGAVTTAMGSYSKALGFYRKAREVLEEHGEPGEVSFALLGSGRVLQRLGDYTGASQPLRRALALRSAGSDPVGEAISRMFLAFNCLELGQLDEALTETRRASFNLRLGPEVSQLGDAEQLLGRIRIRMRQLQQGQEHLEAAHEIHRRQRDASRALVDLSWQLKVALLEENVEEILRLYRRVAAERQDLKPSEREETVDFLLFEAADWLRDKAMAINGDPVIHLRQAYQELSRKAMLLNTELRHRFLFQVPANAAIVQAATERNLTL
ncbi:MAG: tetratricopeptide repeat protein [Deltaproteobacteria bacterium]|nr:tetratricopeptide repeat protein [Deltaproteobacteria bacterium]